MSLCGKCKRYIKYISARPSRMYCPVCEEIYNLPQGGDIKQLSGAVCPLDNFELVQFSMGGNDGKRYPLCPFCYNNPPFEDAVGPKADDKGVLQLPLSLCVRLHRDYPCADKVLRCRRLGSTESGHALHCLCAPHLQVLASKAGRDGVPCLRRRYGHTGHRLGTKVAPRLQQVLVSRLSSPRSPQRQGPLHAV